MPQRRARRRPRRQRVPIDGGTGLFLVQGDADGLTRTGYRTHDGTRAANVRFDGTPAVAARRRRRRQTAAIERALAERPDRLRPRGDRRDGDRAAHDRGVPEDPQAVRRHARTSSRRSPSAPRTCTCRSSWPAASRSGRRWCRTPAATSSARPTAPGCTTSRAGRHIGKEAIQLHGGIGVTAEYSVGHYTSRLHRDRPPARRRRLGPGPAGGDGRRARDGRPAGRPVRLTAAADRADTRRFAQPGVIAEAAASTCVCRPTARCGPRSGKLPLVHHAPGRGGDVLGGEPHPEPADARSPLGVGADHVGGHEQRQQAAHPHALGAPLDLERLGQRLHRGLGRAVGRQRRLPVESRRGAEVGSSTPRSARRR